MILTREQLDAKYLSRFLAHGHWLTDEEVLGEQELMRKTDDMLSGTGLECNGPVKTRDGDGEVSFAINTKKGIYVAVISDTETGNITRNYHIDEMVRLNPKTNGQ